MDKFVPKKPNSYYAVHMHVLLHFGKAAKCENPECVYPRIRLCDRTIMEKPKRYEWANISGEYKREREDWLQLCPSCHRKRDFKIKKSKKRTN